MRIRYPILLTLCGLVCALCSCQRPAAPTPTEPPATGAAAGLGVEARGTGPARRLLVKVIRHRASAELQARGLKSVGGDPTPLTRDQAERLLDQLDDEQILVGAVQAGKLGDGKILDRLGAVVDWVLAHKEEIAAIVKWVLGLLMLFADQSWQVMLTMLYAGQPPP